MKTSNLAQLSAKGPSRTQRLRTLLAEDSHLADRFTRVRNLAGSVRTSEYHLTNACNIRCRGCWFFEHDFDKKSNEVRELDRLRDFVRAERARGVNTALLIGGEPALFPERIAVYAEELERVTISTNGYKAFPRGGFEDVTVAISLFGGGPLDDELRAHTPGGRSFEGLFQTALDNYRGDDRAGFVFAITETGIPYIEDTVKAIADNGNRVTLNFYSAYHERNPLRMQNQARLLETALDVKERYPETVSSHPYYIQTMISGRSHWGTFGYDVCPSISVDHPDHAERLRNGNPSLPFFNTYAPDLETVQLCCTSGHCGECRDSQAIISWLLVSVLEFTDSPERLRTWLEIAEGYWSQFVWSPYHPRQVASDVLRRVADPTQSQEARSC